MRPLGDQVPFELTATERTPRPGVLPDSLLGHLAPRGGSTSTSRATTAGRPNRSRRGSGRYATRVQYSCMPLSVRFRTDSAMTPIKPN